MLSENVETKEVHSERFLVSHSSAYTVVKAIQQINGKWQFCGVRIA